MSKSQNVEYYDVTPKEREIIEWRAARRAQLRELYQKEAYHPTKHGLLFDENIQRFAALRLLHERRFKPTRSSNAWFLGLIGTIVLTYSLSKKNVKEKNQKRMRGEVKLEDIRYKFM